MAGVAAVRAVTDLELKWPNDLLRDERKLGGILVERDDELMVIGLGLDLWWEDPPEGMAGVYEDDPGPERHKEVGALWGAELMELIGSEGWPVVAYRESCVTLGQRITWEPDGQGEAVDVASDGALVVQTALGRETLHSGAIRHLRPI